MQERRHPIAVGPIRLQEREELVAQGPARAGAEGQHPGEVAGFRRNHRPNRLAGEEAGGQDRREIEDLVADRDAGSPGATLGRGAVLPREDPERQVLNRKVGMPVGSGTEERAAGSWV